MNKEPTIEDVLDSMTQKQLALLFSLLSSILDGTYLLDTYVEYEMAQHRYTEPMKKVTKFLMGLARKISKSEVKSEFIKQMAERTSQKKKKTTETRCIIGNLTLHNNYKGESLC